MANLRDLFPDSNYVIAGFVPPALSVLYVQNDNPNNVNNGGRCCLWTVPAGVSWAKFEVYGGGGDGAGGCCCQHPRYGGGSGSYARKTICVNPGDTYTLCAAGTGCCAPTCLGNNGFPSYACSSTALYPLCLCASGGQRGESGCFMETNGCWHWPQQISGSACGFDFAICGIAGGHYDGVYCGFDGFQIVPFGVYEYAMGARYSFDFCNRMGGCTHIGAGAGAPPIGSGGGTANTGGGGCCWGGWGAQGQVIVSFR